MTHANPKDPFADLESDFNGGADEPRPLKPSGEVSDFTRLTLGANETKPAACTPARFPCRKCRGSGAFTSYTGRMVGRCFTCKGTGKQKTDPAKNAQRAAKKAEEKLAALTRAVLAWKDAHPEAYAWMEAKAPNFGFAASLFGALKQWGSLTERQLEAVMKCVESGRTYEERKAQAAAERAAAAPNVSGAGFEKMLAAFAKASESRLKHPKLRVGEFTFAPAKATSKNPGSIYVTHAGKYLGRIDTAGKFLISRECTSQERDEVAKIGADPLAAAVLHGKKTGNCACCGRVLENAESVELGIGPICRDKWGL